MNGGLRWYSYDAFHLVEKNSNTDEHENQKGSYR